MTHEARQRAIIAERDTLVDATARSLGPLRRRLLGVLLDWAQRCGPDREQALFYMGAGWPALRRLALELGRRLAEERIAHGRGHLLPADPRAPDGHLGAGAGRARQARIRGAPAPRGARRRKRLHPPPVVPQGYKARFRSVRHVGVRNTAAQRPGGHDPAGPARQPGRTSAAASVIRFLSRLLKDGARHVLVCPTTTPAWTPLFSQAHGLVTDVGGVLAHGSIVAREYGIPAVLRTGSASRRIRHGQRITVDGDQGLVVLEPDEIYD